MTTNKKLAQNLFHIYTMFNQKNLLKSDANEELSRSHHEVMLFLEAVGERPMSVVARALSYSRANITAIADTLDKKGFLRRSPSKDDRRVILISITTEGKHYLNQYRETMEKAMETRLDSISAEKTAALAGLASEMERILDKLPDAEDDPITQVTSERRITMYKPTVDYFPVQVKHLENLPGPLAKAARNVITTDEMPYTVYIPGYETNDARFNAWLMILQDDGLTIFEEGEDHIVKRHMPMDSIYYMERGCVLLYSWLDFRAVVDGNPFEMRVEFNTVREDLMQPFVDKFRNMYESGSQPICPIEESIDFLKNTDLRFYNYASESMMPNHCIDNIIYQPEITRPISDVIHKRLQAKHLTMIGANEIIDIAETGITDEDTIYNHGAIWRFIPRRAIHSAELQDISTSGSTELMLELDGGENQSFMYGKERKDVLEQVFGH